MESVSAEGAFGLSLKKLRVDATPTITSSHAGPNGNALRCGGELHSTVYERLAGNWNDRDHSNSDYRKNESHFHLSDPVIPGQPADGARGGPRTGVCDVAGSGNMKRDPVAT